MKNILIAGVLGFGLAGCAENKTGLQKNVINTAFDTCQTYLSGGLKSPSSLRINNVKATVKQPHLNDIDNVFGNTIVKDKAVSKTVRDNKSRYREMSMVINYEAQNSYGVYLAGAYQCKYLYELNNKETSPKPLNMYLIGLNSDWAKVDLMGIHIPLSEFKGSNLFLNKHIKTTESSVDSSFSKKDEHTYAAIIEKREAKEREIEERKSKRSSGEIDLAEIISSAEAAADAAAEAAKSISE